jgi:hypothetical protein
LPYPFIHEFVRSTTHRLPTWIGEGTPLRAIAPIQAEFVQELPGDGAVVGGVQMCGHLVGHPALYLRERLCQGRSQERRVMAVRAR